MFRYIALVACLGLPAAAQELNGTSTSTASVATSSGAQAIIINEGANLSGKSESTIRSVPSVSAPAVFGGGHPCLAGMSGGAGIVGYGLSGGKSDAEPVCMLWYMGQPEAAIRALAATNPVACKALNNVGYYRIGNTTAKFNCGEETVKGGVFTGTKTNPKSLLTKCARRADGKITIGYTSAGKTNKQAAQSQCLSSLK